MVLLCAFKGIKLVKADDYDTWLLSLEVLGNSLYAVRDQKLDQGMLRLIAARARRARRFCSSFASTSSTRSPRRS